MSESRRPEHSLHHRLAEALGVPADAVTEGELVEMVRDLREVAEGRAVLLAKGAEQLREGKRVCREVAGALARARGELSSAQAVLLTGGDSDEVAEAGDDIAATLRATAAKPDWQPWAEGWEAPSGITLDDVKAATRTLGGDPGAVEGLLDGLQQKGAVDADGEG